MSAINQNLEDKNQGTLRVCLYVGVSTATHGDRQGAIAAAKVTVSKTDKAKSIHAEGVTGQDGCVDIPLEGGTYIVSLPILHEDWTWQCSGNEPARKGQDAGCMTIKMSDCGFKNLECMIPAETTLLGLDVLTKGDDCNPRPCSYIIRGKPFWIQATVPNALASARPRFFTSNGDLQKVRKFPSQDSTVFEALVGGTSGMSGAFNYGFILPFAEGLNGTVLKVQSEGDAVVEEEFVTGQLTTTTTMTRTATSFTEDTALFIAINNATNALSFDNYLRFMNLICGKANPPPIGFEQQRFDKKNKGYNGLLNKRFLPFIDADSYRVVKAATEAFVMVNCGVWTDNLLPFDPERDNAYLDRRDLPTSKEVGGLASTFNDKYLVDADGVEQRILPYLAVIRSKLPDIPIKKQAIDSLERDGNDLDECFGLLQEKLANPCFLELIWSYWQEEGMLVQSINAISRRFQNMRAPNARDPLANLEMDPLRPLNNLMWGYIQDEQHRLSVVRRNYEYDHHYGLRLDGKALRNFRPADTRSKFLEGFHHLLRLCTVFYKQDDATTVKADAFPVLNALKEVHLVLSQGAHNQFGDLPSTSRIEMLMQQWFLARPEFREFLPTRIMVAYPEPWMDRVDAMKKIQGWTDTSVLHFRNLAIFGEQLLLSIRWGHWSDVFEPTQAFNWARLYRPQIQGYIHAYRAATGVDLSADPTVDTRVDSTLPSLLLQRRLATQQRAV